MTSVAFIGGMGRSGSTLLEQALASADGVCALGEVVHLWRRGVLDDELCSCGAAFSRCPFWQEVGRVAFGGWSRAEAVRMLELHDRVDRLRYVPSALLTPDGFARARVMRAYGGAFARVYSAAAGIADARLVLDSSKHASTAAVLSRTPGVALRVVHVVRDSRGVAYSWTTVKQRPEAAGRGAAAIMRRYPPWQSAVLWAAQNVSLAALSRRGVPVRLLRYEDLVRDPGGRLAEIFDFVGVDRAAAGSIVDGTTVRVRSAHQVSGNPSRFSAGPVALTPDERWRRELPGGGRRLVTALTAPLLVHYGYAGPRRGTATRPPAGDAGSTEDSGQ
jgi:hypothetical protein